MAEVGRPTIMTEIALQKLEEAYSNDATDLQACFLANISKSTLYNYQEKHPEFVERKKQLKAMTAYQAKKNIRDKVMEGDIDTSRWLLPKKEKADYSERQELSGPDGKELSITWLHDQDNNNKLPPETVGKETA